MRFPSRLLVGLGIGAMLPSCGQSSPPADAAADVPHAEATAPGTDASPMDAMMQLLPDAPMELAALDASMDVMALDVPSIGAYPPGPYGNAQGTVLANLSWQGYVNPTGNVVSSTLPWVSTSMQDMRALGRRYALVHESDFY